jgi:hypothetical protein
VKNPGFFFRGRALLVPPEKHDLPAASQAVIRAIERAREF